MNAIARPAIDDAIRLHPDAERWLNDWWAVAKSARWASLHHVRQLYPAADQVGGCLVFDACGNKYRLIVGISYASQWGQGALFIKYFLTHAEYDKDAWKKDCLS